MSALKMQAGPVTLPDLFSVRISAMQSRARDVVELEVASEAGTDLPPFTPGAHIDLHLANGLVRQYSLCNYGESNGTYRIAVGLAELSRGGSSHIHAEFKVGTRLLISAPRNNFPIEPNASGYLFVAGGIGITPILSMLRWCEINKKPWRLLYCTRSRDRAAYLSDIVGLSFAQLIVHCDHEAGGTKADVNAVISTLKPGEHIYCCGPSGLMQAVAHAAESYPEEQVHFEWFTRSDVHGPTQSREFNVVLRQSGLTIPVSADQSILEAIEDAGVMVPFGCRDGLCGSCLTHVCSGEPDHRDQVLTDAERKSGTVMMICVSRAKGGQIELDL